MQGDSISSSSEGSSGLEPATMDAAPDAGHEDESSETQEPSPAPGAGEMSIHPPNPVSKPAFGTMFAAEGCGQEQVPGPGQQRPPQILLVHWSLAVQTTPAPCFATHVPALPQ
jgi:hypothetical protein